jgi:hypothetical protein
MDTNVIRLSPDEWLAAWKPQAQRLHLVLPGPPAVRQPVAMRIELQGHILHVTVLGKVVGLQRTGGVVKAEVVPDPISLAAIALFDTAARGEVVPFRDRTRRFVAKLPVAVLGRTGPQFMTTENLSPGGCALRWSGSPPEVHQLLRLRFGMGQGSPELDGSVRWVRHGTVTSVGIRFSNPRSAALLAPLLETVTRSQALAV